MTKLHEFSTSLMFQTKISFPALLLYADSLCHLAHMVIFNFPIARLVNYKHQHPSTIPLNQCSRSVQKMSSFVNTSDTRHISIKINASFVLSTNQTPERRFFQLTDNVGYLSHKLNI